MAELKRMCCPVCGYRYGFRWMFITMKTVEFLTIDKRRRCPNCKTALCLEGKNEIFAGCVWGTSLLLASFFGFYFAPGLEKMIIGTLPGIFGSLLFTILLAILMGAIIFGALYIIHRVVIVPFCKSLGYISKSTRI